MNGSVSGMDYGKIQGIIEEVNNCKAKMGEQLEKLINTVPAAVAESYSGDAAEQYKTTFMNTATKINTTMDEITEQLRKNTTVKEEEYRAQDQAMKNSTDLTN